MLVSRQVILIGLEATTGTPATLTGSDAVLVNSLTLSNTGARMIERPVIKQTLGPLQQVFGGTLQQVQFACEVKGSGAAGTAPEIDAALQACGFKSTVTDSTSVVYNVTSETTKSATIELYQDGVYRQIVGARGTVTFTLNAGEIMTAEFTFTGHYNAHSDKNAPDSIDYDDTVPAPLIGLTEFKIGANVANVGAFTIDVGNTITTPADITNDMGYGEILISDRDATGTLDPEMKLLTGGPDYLTDWMEGNTAAVTTGEIGSAAGNKIKVDLAKIAYRDVGQADRDGMLTESLSFGAHDATADDAIKITFT